VTLDYVCINKDGRPARNQCVDCKLLMCHECENEHKQRRLFKRHSFIPISSISVCQAHSSEMCYRCMKCKKSLCKICALISCADHEDSIKAIKENGNDESISVNYITEGATASINSTINTNNGTNSSIYTDTRYFCYIECIQNMTFFSEQLAGDLADIKSISLGYNSFIVLYNDGQTAWSAGIPKLLHNKLNGRQKSLPRPSVISIGSSRNSKDSYFVQFTDGSAKWNGLPDELEAKLKNDRSDVAILALGDDDIFYVMFESGEELWNLPTSLSNLINGRNGTRRRGNPNLANIADITVSDKGDWAVRFTDNTCKWDQDSIMDNEVVQTVLSCKHIHHIVFGHNSDFVVIYDE